MDGRKLPIAATYPEDNNRGIVTPAKRLVNPSHHSRPRVAVEPPGCLSLLDQGEQNGRPSALLSPDVTSKAWIAKMKVKPQPSAHALMPRAILSSPENDALSGDLQPEAEESKHIMIAPPKAPISLAEDFISTGVWTNFVTENSLSSVDINQENLNISRSSERSLGFTNSSNSLDPSNSRISRHKVIKRNSSGQCTRSETKTVSASSGYDENFLTPIARNQLGKKHVCIPSAPSNAGLKMHAHKATTKDDSGRVIRPWY